MREAKKSPQWGSSKKPYMKAPWQVRNRKLKRKSRIAASRKERNDA